jgi:hypothetical protein
VSKLEANKISAFCMGSASDGPLLISAEKGTSFYDINNFEQMGLPAGDGGPGQRQFLEGGFYWPSADGRVFGRCGNWGMPNGVATVILEGGQVKQFSEHWGTWYVQPGPDGRHIYPGGHGVLTNRVKPASDAVYSSNDNSGHCDFMFLPAHHGPYYMHLHLNTDGRAFGRAPVHKDDPQHGVTVYMLGSRQPLAQLRAIGLTTYERMAAINEIGIERSVHLIPRAKLLVIIPVERDRLLLHPLDLEAELDRTGINYLMVTSQPPAEIRRGAALTYQMVVKAKAGGVVCKLESGPPGMTLTPQGLLRWTVPAKHADRETSVIISVRDSGGQEIFHTFTLALRDGK